MSQKQTIIKALRRGTTLTPMVAWYKFNITKLSTRIGEIIRGNMLEENEKIVFTEVKKNNKRWMSYKLIKEN